MRHYLKIKFNREARLATTGRTEWWVLAAPVTAVVAVAAALAWWAGALGPAAQDGAAPQQQNVTNSVGIELVPIAGGSYVMGSETGGDEAPSRQVTVAPFYLGKYEVTQAQWQAVMGYNPSAYRHPQRPVDQVTWLEVQSFIDKLNRAENTSRYRLPSEAEWEYAARAGSSTTWFFGNDAAPLERYAWVNKTGDIGTRPVGRGAPNPWGLYDMYGNVWEWVQDCWHDNYAGAPPVGGVWSGGDCSLRMLRGGGWNSPPAFARSAVRGSYAPYLNDNANGFRLARSQ